MDESEQRAQDLRDADIELMLARQHSGDLDQAHLPWQLLSWRRFATLSGILTLLEDADKKCSAAGADPQSPIATEIRDLTATTKRQVRSLRMAYGMIAAAALVVGAIACWKLWAMPVGDSPHITDPKVGDEVDMNTPVSGSSPRGFLPPETQLYVLVKPLGHDPPFNYWLQPMPDANLAGWHADIGVGVSGDVGKHFLICAILTSQELSSGWNAPEPPPGESHCIEVIRK